MPSHASELTSRIQDRTATVAVIGLGYVGLPTAVAFAEHGFTTIGADVSEAKVAAMQAGRSPVPEVVSDEQIAGLLAGGKLEVTTDVVDACGRADAVLLIVPTPVHEDKKPDLSFVRMAAEDAAKALRPGQLVVLESTTYPGTSEDILIPALEQASGLKAGADFGVAYCPERYNPSDKEHTLDNVVRVTGAIDAEWCDAAAALYGVLNNNQVHKVSDLRTAEASKVIENIQRDLNIALANELALVFERLNIDIEEVMEAAATKWNFIPFHAGPGVGGHCLPVDPYYLTWAGEQAGHEAKVILAGRALNDSMPHHVVDLVKDALESAGHQLDGSKVAVLGLAYKANTGDARETPARAIVEGLRAKGAQVAMVDPWIPEGDVESLFGAKPMDLEAAIADAHAVVLVTDHPEFKNLDLSDLASGMVESPVFVDTRNVRPPADYADAGFTYRGVGRRA